MESVPMLVGGRRALLVGMGGHQGGVQVDDQRARRGRAQRPRGLPRPAKRRPQPGHPARVGRELLGDHPPRGRGRADLTQQLRLVTQARQVTKPVPTVGQHHHKIPQHRAPVVAAGPPAQVGTPTKLGGQPHGIGGLGQQQTPGMADQVLAIGGDQDAGTRLGRLHRQGDLSDRERGRQTAASSLAREVPCYSMPTPSAAA